MATRSPTDVNGRCPGAFALASALVRADPAATIRTFGVLVLSSFAQGVGLLALLPILDALSHDGRMNGSGAGRVMDRLGIGSSLGAMLACYALLVIGAAALAGYGHVRTFRLVRGFTDDLRARMLTAVGFAWWRHVVTLRRADLINSLTTSTSLVTAGAFSVGYLAVSALLISVQLAVAFVVAPAVACLILATALFMTALTVPLLRRSKRLGEEIVDSEQAVLLSATGFLDGLRMAKAHAVVSTHINEFRAATTGARASGLSAVRAFAVASTVRAGTTAGVLAVTLYVGHSHLGVSIAQLLVLALIFNRVLPQIGDLQSSLSSLIQAGPAYADLMGVITVCEAAGEPAPHHSRPARPLRESVQLREVGFAYTPGVEVLDGVTLTIPAHRTTALVGPSGAGKTTLADTVIGLLRPDRGEILLDGVPLLEEEIGAWRSQVALVPQDPFLFTDTIAANLRWAAPDANEDQLWAALSEAAAARFVSALPDRLNTVVGDRGARLSGGERQRITLARALLRRPQLIVLDEPTSAMDTETEQLVRATVARLHGRHTVLLIAHRLSTVRDADQVVVLEAGRVVEAGTWEQLADRDRSRLNDLIRAGAFA